ncbi:MAG TPA: hypothetical protein VFZ83_12465 [Acidimicrobiia bacterium]|nr:hypothetical protein [Acidimicrobiia bacterium]
MESVFLLASTAGEKGLWDPLILGVLVVISAVGLFCGSVYLLLATNLGARLGFLVAAACLSGFMILLSMLWLTTATPLNSPRGSIPEWEVVDVVENLGASDIGAVQRASDGEPIDAAELAALRPGLDASLVVPTAEGEEAVEASEFAEFDTANEFLVEGEDLASYEVGGGTKNVLWHHPRYAAIEFCTAATEENQFGQRLPTDRCDPNLEPRFAILERDLGTLRKVPLYYLLFSVAFFAASLLGLHWYELDRRRAAQPPARTTT